MQVIHTNLAPEAIGTYSQAVSINNTVYLSGQIPLNPQTMTVCSEEVGIQIKQVFENLNAVCRAAGGSLTNIVKLTIYLTDLANFKMLNEIMAHYFKPPYPARAVIGVNALPRNVQIEIDGIMILSTH